MCWTRLSLVVTEAFVALSAFGAGVMFMAVPGGRLMGMTDATLARSPFRSYLVPGIVLFVVVGGTQALAAWAETWRWPRAGCLAVVTGVVLVGWIADGQRRDGSCGRCRRFRRRLFRDLRVSVGSSLAGATFFSSLVGH